MHRECMIISGHNDHLWEINVKTRVRKRPRDHLSQDSPASTDDESSVLATRKDLLKMSDEVFMKISIKPEFEAFIHGRYRSADEVIENALARLMADETDAASMTPERADLIRRSLQDISNGDELPFEEAANQLRQQHLAQ